MSIVLQYLFYHFFYVKYAGSSSRSNTHGTKLFPGVINILKYTSYFILKIVYKNSAARPSLPGDLIFVSEFVNFIKHLKLFPPHKN